MSRYWVPGDAPDLGFDASWIVFGGKRRDGAGVRLVASTKVSQIVLTVDWDWEEEISRSFTLRAPTQRPPVMRVETSIGEFVVVDAPTFAEAWERLADWSKQQDAWSAKEITAGTKEIGS